MAEALASEQFRLQREPLYHSPFSIWLGMIQNMLTNRTILEDESYGSASDVSSSITPPIGNATGILFPHYRFTHTSRSKKCSYYKCRKLDLTPRYARMPSWNAREP
jgi:hypothetical protein